MRRALVVMLSLTATLAYGLTARAQVTVDGVVDAAYGAPIATDKAADAQGSLPMDLRKLYVTHDATHLYIAFTIAENITVAGKNWGKYILYIDTTGNAQGATKDAWGRNVAVADPHKPEYSINTWVDQTPYGADKVQFWAWDGGAWNQPASAVAAAALKGTTGESVVEYKISRAALGSPSKIWVEVFSTGANNADNAQDTINDPAEDSNATDWTTKSQLAVSTPYSFGSATTDAGLDAAAAKDARPPDAGPNVDVRLLDRSSAADAPARDLKLVDQLRADTQVAPDKQRADLRAPDRGTVDAKPIRDGAAAADQRRPDAASKADAGQPDAAAIADAPRGDGSSRDGAAKRDAGKKPGAQDEGCACATAEAHGGAGTLLLLTCLGLALIVSRRRR